MGDTAMPLNPVLWSERLSVDRGHLNLSLDPEEEEECESRTFELLEPNHSFLYSTILSRNITTKTILNLSLPTTTTEIVEKEQITPPFDVEKKEFEEDKPSHKKTPCKRISYKIKRSASAYRKLGSRNPIRGSTVAELASKFDKLCSEKKYILDDPKFAQIIKRVNSQNYSQGDASGKIVRKSSIKVNMEDKNNKKSFNRSGDNKGENIPSSINVRQAIKNFEDRQKQDTQNLQIVKPKPPEKKFSKSLDSVHIAANTEANEIDIDDDFHEPVQIVNLPVEKTIRSESAYEITHVKLKKYKPIEIKALSTSSLPREDEENQYDLVIPSIIEKKIQPPVPPKPKKNENLLLKQIMKKRIPEPLEQEKAYEELSAPPSETTHSYEDIEQKDDDGYEAIIPLNIIEQNIYETLPNSSDCPPPLPKRQEELLPPKLPAKNRKVQNQDETNSYEVIEPSEIFRTNLVNFSEGASSDSSYDTLMQLKRNGSGSASGSNRGSLISYDQQSNSLYGRSIPSWTEECLNNKNQDSDSFSDRSDEWSDIDENEDNYPESTIVQRRKSRHTHRNPINNEADTDHHYESVPDGYRRQNHYAPESFDSDYDTADPRNNMAYSNGDITSAQLPDTPNSQINVLDRLSTAGKSLKKRLLRMTKKKSRTDLDNLNDANNTLDRDKARSVTKLNQRSPESVSYATPRNSLTSQDSNNDYETQKLKNKAKSTFYLTEPIDISEKDDCDKRKNSLSPTNMKSKNRKSSPVRPSIPPPPLPKQLSASELSTGSKNELNKRCTSWYVDTALIKNPESEPNNKSKRNSTSWYAEVGLYERNTSTPSTSSAENSGSGVSNRNELDDINYENSEHYNNLKNQTEYNNSIDSFGSNETKMDKSASALSEDMQLLLQEEPLYQFYNDAILKSICHEGTDWDSDGYEEISKADDGERQIRPSAMDLITNNGNNISVSRTLWCEIQEVKNSDIFNTLHLEEKKLQEAKFEMMTSEASYLNSLNVLTKHFIQNLYKCKSASKEDLDIIFGRIPAVKNCSEKLLQDIEKCWQDNILLQDICNIIHKHAEENFAVYVSYCENQVLLDRTLKKLRDGGEFKEILLRLETSMDCQALTLHSFLMLPMQRVTRWPLLLDAVLKRLTPGDAEYLSCQCALTTINKIVYQCNEAARSKEREAEMKAIVDRIIFGMSTPSFDLMSEGRWLIKSGPITQMLSRNDDGKLTFGKKFTKKPLFLFLFNDLFIISKYQTSEDNYNVLHYCPRNMIEINVDMAPNLPVKDTMNRHLIFLTILENQHQKLVEILFSCNSTTDKERWLNVLSPAKSDDPNETLYERWDCPQVTVIYDYNIDQPDELNITKGEVIYVIRKMSDGWYYGERLRDGQCGWFPSNYVREIVNPHVRARNLKQRYRLLAFTQNYFNSKQ